MTNRKTRDLLLVCVASAALAAACGSESETLSFEMDGQQGASAPSKSAGELDQPTAAQSFRPSAEHFASRVWC